MSFSGLSEFDSVYSLYGTDSASFSPPDSPWRVVHRKRSAYRCLPTPPSSPRPLPSVPRMLTCKNCNSYITTPMLICKDTPRRFKGFSGQAGLFNEIYNANLSPPQVQLMLTGAHTTQLISCSTCDAYLGFKIIRAHETTERWKEGRCLLELENLSDVVMGYCGSSDGSQSS